MDTTEFVAKQLALPGPDRVIPDRIYIADNRIDDIQTLRKGLRPYNAADVFMSEVLYEKS